MKRIILIAGPCVIESEELVLRISDKLINISCKLGLDFYFKASFDKANRTSINSYRGPGLMDGLRVLAKVKDKNGCRIVTDIHEPYQAVAVAEVVDIIQIPAFLCRQTDLLIAAAKTRKMILVKKAQFLAAVDMKNVVHKIEESGNKSIILCERGSSFGYHQLVADMTSLVEMKKLGYPVAFDATHSVQKPGSNGTSTGGNREYVEPLALAAIAAGADALFIETHPDPDHALSDGPNMVPLDELAPMLRRILNVYEVVRRSNNE